MTNRDRFLNTLNFKKVDDRLPMIEWADWWDKTIGRWRSEGLSSDIGWDETREYFGLDMVRQFWLRPYKGTFPYGAHGTGPVSDPVSYEGVRPHLYPDDCLEWYMNRMLKYKDLHQKGDTVIWITLEGFFWFPRTLFGIENHMYAFYDYPELMHKINEDLTEFHIGLIDKFCQVIKPDFMSFAEDMSYNHGPMLSYELFKEFLLPYYKRIIPVLKKYDIIPFIDTDGNLESMIPWLIEAGIEGVFPLERQAGVDINRIRKKYPQLKMFGGYDKMVMDKGEAAMRAEFERLLPAMKSGGFIPSCDHQTPPAVSLKDYEIYLRLLREYCEKAVK